MENFLEDGNSNIAGQGSQLEHGEGFTKFKTYIEKHNILFHNGANSYNSSMYLNGSSSRKNLITSLKVTIDMRDIKKFSTKLSKDSTLTTKKYYFNLKLLNAFEENSRHSKIYFYFDGITSAIKNKELRKNLEEKDMILANVTHDLRAPLIAVSHTLERVQQESLELKKETQNMIKGALTSCNLLNFLINDILDAAKIVKFGTLKLNMEVSSIDDIFTDIFKIMKHQFNVKGVDFETFISDNVPEYLVSDPRRLKQIILNFVTNAFKFTTKGKVLLMAKMLETSTDVIEISVLDTGIGIPEEEQAKIFDKFYTSGGKVNKNGVGLGLSICKTLCKLLGPTERIYFTSKFNKGSKFWVYIYVDLEQRRKMLDENGERDSHASFDSKMLEDSLIPSQLSNPSFKDLPRNDSRYLDEDPEFYSDESGIESIRMLEINRSDVKIFFLKKF